MNKESFGSDEMNFTRQLRCLSKDFFDLMTKSQPNESTHTLNEQINTEELVKKAYENFLNDYKQDPDRLGINRDQHIKFLLRGLRNLPSSFECLDASRPWICYWILHALYLLDAKVSDDMIDDISNFLDRCQSENGGFGGGPGQISHLATTYAAVNALCTLNSTRALQIIKREKLFAWIKSLKLSTGAFRMHDDGEEDLRGAYCAISVAKLCNLEQLDPDLFDGTAEWVVKCQTYEGGFGATPDNEAHGGYGFCGLAALKLLGKESLCDVELLTRWLVNKQMKFEGGFQGRTNKLVDACYSFWQAGMFPIIQSILMKDYDPVKQKNIWLFDPYSLQEYILLCCQCSNGGVIDKPGKNRDYYHTCYGLSGLSISQYFCNNTINICPTDEALLNKTHPLFNVGFDSAFKAINYFSSGELTRTRSAELNQLD